MAVSPHLTWIRNLPEVGTEFRADVEREREMIQRIRETENMLKAMRADLRAFRKATEAKVSKQWSRAEIEAARTYAEVR